MEGHGAHSPLIGEPLGEALRTSNRAGYWLVEQTEVSLCRIGSRPRGKLGAP
jgi:hypothetical protein